MWDTLEGESDPADTQKARELPLGETHSTDRVWAIPESVSGLEDTHSTDRMRSVSKASEQP